MKHICNIVALFFCATALFPQTEPQAGQWKTWFIPSVEAYRLPPPPAHKSEIAAVLNRQKTLDSATLQEITFWNTGSPGYRWQLLLEEVWMSDALKNGILANMLVPVAIYDATVAAWDTKYTYNRKRPFAVDKRVSVHAIKPESPSYPCEHSVAAGAASTIIAHFFPALADSVQRMAQRVMDARIAAGMAFPSDTRAGFELGRQIAAKEIEHTKGFLNNTAWDGKRPDRPGLWNGPFAMLPSAGTSKTIVLKAGNQFRPGPPPDFAKDMAELKNFKQTHGSMANALLFDSQNVWKDLLDKKVMEYNLQHNPPRAAHVYAVAAIGVYDGFVACWDAKYTYWGIRPEQYDTTYQPLLFESPPFPGYPSGHAAVGAVQAGLLSYFFPAERVFFQKMAKRSAESRFQGGIHFRTDNEVALELGRKVADAIVDQIKNDEVNISLKIKKK